MSADSTWSDDGQRREDVRVRICLPVELSARIISLADFRNTGRGGCVFSGHTITVSGGGFAVLHHEAVAIGTSFNVRLQMPDCPAPLTMKAKVVRCKLMSEGSDIPLFELGLCFTRIAESVRSRIVSHVFRVQRMAITENGRNEREE